MAEREADMEEDAGNLLARHDDGEEEDGRRLLGMEDEDQQLGDEDQQLGDEDQQLGDEDQQLGDEDQQLGDEDAEAPESVELDAPAERSGHVAVVDRNIMYVWGGYKNGQNHGFVDLYLPQNEVWTYNMESGVWMKHVTRGNLHSMSGSCGTCLDGVFYLFGGHHARGNTNRIYRLPLRAPSLVWEEMRDLKGLPPSSKDKLGCWVHKNRLIFFGGYGYTPQRSHLGAFEGDETYSVLPQWEAPKRGWNNHIHVLDLETSAWSQPITQGSTPSPRAAHACATVGNRGYVFGGRFKNYRLNDLYYMDLETWEWHEMGVPQNLVGRSWHSFTPVSADHIFLFGGFTTQRETLSDAWLYCISRNEWRPFNHSYSMSPRLWHTACSGPDGEVFVFGGCANNLLSHERAAHSNELLIFNVQPKSLVGFCMEAVLQHREKLSSHWDCLPKHLLLSLKQRMSRVNTLGS